MRISTFTDEYGPTAPLYGLTPERLREIDGLHDEHRPRWLASADDGGPIGVVTSHLRADGRLFGHFGGDPATAGPLADVVIATLGRDLHVSVPDAEAHAFAAAGFHRLRVEDRFSVEFAAAFRHLGERAVPDGYAVRTADTVDGDRLMALDTALRQDVPGTRGWKSDRKWFWEETFDSPYFDPSGYLVAVHEATGEYAGLARFWRNDDGPRLGLLAVRRHHRGTGLAAALLSRAMRAAAGWGFDAFTTESDPATEVMHGWLTALGGVRTGRDVELVRDDLTLERVELRHGPGYVAMIDECERAGEGYPWNNVPLARTDFAAFVAELDDEAIGVGLPEGCVPQRTYVLVKAGTELLGEFRLRPTPTEPFEEHNGHIGYNLRPNARGCGYGTRGLAMVLDEARRLDVPGVMLTVEGVNDPSTRVIEKNAGRLVRVYGERVRSYWIDL